MKELPREGSDLPKPRIASAAAAAARAEKGYRSMVINVLLLLPVAGRFVCWERRGRIELMEGLKFAAASPAMVG